MVGEELRHCLHENSMFASTRVRPFDEEVVTTMDKLGSFIDGAVHAAGKVGSFLGGSVEMARLCAAVTYMTVKASVERAVEVHDNILYGGNAPEGYRDGVQDLLNMLDESELGKKAEETLSGYFTPI